MLLPLVALLITPSLCKVSHDFENEPLSVVWSYASKNCENFGIDVAPKLDEFGLIRNSDGRYTGGNIQLLYRLGNYPEITSKKRVRIINGGIPQMKNLKGHLEAVQKELEDVVPQNFSGIGTIDWEMWRPLWDTNDNRTRFYYRNLQEKLIKEQFGDIPYKEVQEKAKQEFELAARSYMEETVLMARKMYPNSFWGYYIFPTCFVSKGNSYDSFLCNQRNIGRNNRLSWLWKSSNVLMPSLYWRAKIALTTTQLIWMVNGRLQETVRVVSNNSLIFPYINIGHLKEPVFFEKEKLYAMIGMPVNFGISGVIIWGSKKTTRDEHGCKNLDTALKGTVGPYVQELLKASSKCSQESCSGHGRCADKRFLDKLVLKSLSQKEVINALAKPFQIKSEIQCNCYPKWTGEKCQNEK